ncbi:hypothetical protein MJT46_015432 [Ovis ammon polii x Ovis aries]|nr:hypothetical protein MJT46_015432 [Ovis ammon polii x Ovis aries]
MDLTPHTGNPPERSINHPTSGFDSHATSSSYRCGYSTPFAVTLCGTYRLMEAKTQKTVLESRKLRSPDVADSVIVRYLPLADPEVECAIQLRRIGDKLNFRQKLVNLIAKLLRSGT